MVPRDSHTLFAVFRRNHDSKDPELPDNNDIMGFDTSIYIYRYFLLIRWYKIYFLILIYPGMYSSFRGELVHIYNNYNLWLE